MKLQHPPNGHRLKQELAAAIARAEAAERRVAELEARLAALVTGPGGFNERADIIKELRAQLAAQAWRPVTEKPIEPGTYLVYDADGEPYLFAGVWPYRVARWDNGWGSGLDGLVDYWRPLPAPPIDPPAPA